jgi:putative peptidoglycan lipid II flippase
MLPMLLGLGILQLNILLDNLIADFFVEGNGAVSSLYFGNRLMQFPLAIIGIALGVAVFPVLARLSAMNDMKELKRTLSDVLGVTLFFAIPATAGIIFLSEDIVTLLFKRGQFDATAVARTTNVVVFYTSGLFAATLLQVITRAFYSLKDTKTPVKIAVISVFLNITLNLILVQTPLKEAGLALATSITSVVNLVFLIIIFKHKYSFDFEFIFSGLKTLFATIIMTLGLLLLLNIIGDSGTFSFLEMLFKVLGCVGFCFLVFGFLSIIFNKSAVQNVLRG